MKRCLQCNRVESDEALSFCRVDGASLIPDAFGTAYLAMVLGRAGHVDEARKLLQELKNASSRRDVPSIAFAFAYMGVNQKEEAMAMLEKEVEERGYWAVSFAVEPALDEFRSEPPIQGHAETNEFAGMIATLRSTFCCCFEIGT